MFDKFYKSSESQSMYDSYEDQVERRKNLKLLEFMELEKEEKFPFISPCFQSYADEIRAESNVFYENQNSNKYQEPNRKRKSIDKNTLFQTDTLING